MMLIVLSCNKSDPKSYKYPGNGIAYISKDLHIYALERDIWAYAQAIPGTREDAGKLVFKDVKSFKFKSPKEIDKGLFSLEVTTNVKKGYCDIGIGNINLKVGPNALYVENNGVPVYSNNSIEVPSVTVDNFPDAQGSLKISIVIDGCIIDMPWQQLESPAYITIDLSDDFSGAIGPWMWLRGYE